MARREDTALMRGMEGDTSMAYMRWERAGAGRLTHCTPFILLLLVVTRLHSPLL